MTGKSFQALVASMRLAEGNDAYTKLLLHCDGADASTTFTDSSSSARSATVGGSAQIDTAQSKFGGASGLFDGSGDYLEYADSADWDFGADPFTIDMWVRTTTVSGRQTLAIKSTLAEVTSWALYILNANFEFNASANDSSWGIVNAQTFGTISTNTWTHVAVVRDGNDFKLFQDGDLKTTVTNSGALTANSKVVRIGAQGTHSFSGHLDEVRISKGIARWTANFTPPSAAYG